MCNADRLVYFGLDKKDFLISTERYTWCVSSYVHVFARWSLLVVKDIKSAHFIWESLYWGVLVPMEAGIKKLVLGISETRMTGLWKSGRQC